MCRTRAPASSSRAVPTTGITVYGCDEDEALLFGEIAPRFGVTPTVTKEAVSEANVGLAAGNRCVSVGHKTRVTRATLTALSRVGVEYLSTRSVGCDHIDVSCAESVGISVGNVEYSPDSVADYTLMMMLMAVRHAKATIRRADAHDYRLSGIRGKELRDLTVGVVGTGRIGTAVIDRLRGFGCRVLAYDSRTKTSAEHVRLDELLRHSDVVTLHTPLTAETRHLLNRRRIERLKHGAFLVNTGRGPLIDTDASFRRWRAAGWAARRWTFSTVRRASSTATAGTNPSRTARCCDCKSCRTCSSAAHGLLHRHALRDTVRNSIINCLDFESGKT